MIPASRSPGAVFRFFAWVFAWSLPFYAWGIIWPVRGLPFGLPATVIMIVVPAAVATISTSCEMGAAAAGALWRGYWNRYVGSSSWQ